MATAARTAVLPKKVGGAENNSTFAGRFKSEGTVSSPARTPDLNRAFFSGGGPAAEIAGGASLFPTPLHSRRPYHMNARRRRDRARGGALPGAAIGAVNVC